MQSFTALRRAEWFFEYRKGHRNKEHDSTKKQNNTSAFRKAVKPESTLQIRKGQFKE